MRLKIGGLVKKLIRLSLTGLAIIVVLEIALRALGYSFPERAEGANRPIIQSPDELLGWKLKPGSYQMPPFHPKGDSTDMSINKNGNRITKTGNTPVANEEIYFIGGSFTLGVGLSDDQCYVWKLQEKLPDYTLKNLAVGAYGSLQSLITLEKELKKAGKPKHVIYGYIDHHKIRDVAHHSWLNMFYNASGGYSPKIPYATIDNRGELKRDQRIRITRVPLSKKLVSFQLAQRALNKAIAYPREKEATEVSRLLIKEMKKFCDQIGAEFYVAVLLEVNNTERLIPFLTANEIKYIDCHVALNESNRVKGDEHPDESVHDIYADRILRRLQQDGLRRTKE